ncbi:MAG: DUF5666 domain-containing protein, partial [Usitatibacteraceae bacterium]
MKKDTCHNHSGRYSAGYRAKFGLFTFVAMLLGVVTATTLGAYVRTGGSGRDISYGEIEDFGSIVVNGVHYDETAANIIIDGAPGQSRAALKLGMIAQIDGQRDYALNTGIADTVRVDRVMYGQIESINNSTAEVRILAQRVSIGATTRFDGATGLAGLAAGDWIAVHGLEDPGRKSVVATLVERVANPGAAESTIRGTVQNVQSGRLRVGRLDVLAFNSQARDGDYVSIRGDYLGGVLVSTNVVVTREVETEEDDNTELQGYVSDFRSISDFTIAGVSIDASRARLNGGTASDLTRNIRVTVEGTITNGVLQATEIGFPGATSATTAATSAEVEGTITAYSSLGDFVVKGRRIDASALASKIDRLPRVGW